MRHIVSRNETWDEKLLRAFPSTFRAVRFMHAYL